MSVPTHKSDATRQRLLDAANQRFRTSGYGPTTANAIAADAGVTERTFFRYFPSKAAVLVANWEGHATALRTALKLSTKRTVADVVREALIVFTDRIEEEMAVGVDSVVRLVADRDAFLAITETLMDIEHEIAAEIAARSSRGVDDFDVRAAANASFGVFRAAVRSSVVYPRGPSMSERVAMGMRRLRPLFAAVSDANH